MKFSYPMLYFSFMLRVFRWILVRKPLVISTTILSLKTASTIRPIVSSKLKHYFSVSLSVELLGPQNLYVGQQLFVCTVPFSISTFNFISFSKIGCFIPFISEYITFWSRFWIRLTAQSRYCSWHSKNSSRHGTILSSTFCYSFLGISYSWISVDPSPHVTYQHTSKPKKLIDR